VALRPRPVSTAASALGGTCATTLWVTTTARRGMSPAAGEIRSWSTTAAGVRLSMSATAGEIRSRSTAATEVRLRMPAPGTTEVGIGAPTTTTAEVRVGPRATAPNVRRGVRGASTRVRMEATTTRPAAEVIVRDRRGATRASRIHRRTAATGTGPVLQARMDGRAGSTRTKASRCGRSAAAALGADTRRATRSTATVLGANMRRGSRSATAVLESSRRSGRPTAAVLGAEVARRAGTSVFKPVPTPARPTVCEVMRRPTLGPATARTDNSVARENSGA
jgi:hypothetical protein